MFRSRARRWGGALAVVAFTGASITIGQWSGATPLATSTFDGADGNLLKSDTEIPGGSGSDAFDWENAPNLSAQRETNLTPQTDNSFGQGTKEDTPVPTVIDGSIPNNKSDLTRFYVANDKGSTGDDFIHLAWERANTLGTANMDFELNQKYCDPNDSADADCTGNDLTPFRTAGDVLITYDFAGGGKNVELGVHKWLTSGSAAACAASNSLPCWGWPVADDTDGTVDGRLDLDASGYANGAVNDGFSVSDPITVLGQPGGTVLDKRFGEASINATASGILPRPGSGSGCNGFGSAYLKSRSSDSFTAAVKDFVAPTPVAITNCGSIKIVKTSDNGPLAGAEFTLYNDNTPVGGTWSDPNADPAGNDTESTIDPNSCTTALVTVNSVTTATCTISNVPFGNYWVVETVTPSGYKTANPQQANVTSSNNPILTFNNLRKQATIQVQKNDDVSPTANPIPNVIFDFYVDGPVADTFDDAGTSAGTCTTNTAGTCSVSGLLVDTYYWVVERDAPAGYTPDFTSPTRTCTINSVAKACQRVQVPAGSSTTADPDPLTVTFVNKRLFKVLVFVCQESTGELYAAGVGLGAAGSTTVPATSATSATAPPTDVDEAKLCAATGGATFSGKTTGDYPAAVDIN